MAGLGGTRAAAGARKPRAGSGCQGLSPRLPGVKFRGNAVTEARSCIAAGVTCPGEGHPQLCPGRARGAGTPPSWAPGSLPGPAATVGRVPTSLRCARVTPGSSGALLERPRAARASRGLLQSPGSALPGRPRLSPPQAPAWGGLAWLPPLLQRCQSVPGPFEAAPGASRGRLWKPRTRKPRARRGLGRAAGPGAAGPETFLPFPVPGSPRGDPGAFGKPPGGESGRKALVGVINSVLVNERWQHQGCVRRRGRSGRSSVADPCGRTRRLQRRRSRGIKREPLLLTCFDSKAFLFPAKEGSEWGSGLEARAPEPTKELR
ncbi:collagen alpha-1(VII) chain-like [Vidua chalybeata]|uniref:collagen alpha-1(VII) chain-like n=1 Tax=Vidua chalybeata TaxID=81927 RepID=UPI0023A8047D|nr:collagen alpha-1(VII) chain-like [Vidua chalybeata]